MNLSLFKWPVSTIRIRTFGLCGVVCPLRHGGASVCPSPMIRWSGRGGMFEALQISIGSSKLLSLGER